LAGENDVEEVPHESSSPALKKEAIKRNNGIFIELSANALADPRTKRRADI
jgi:hypothetical protein